MKKFLKYLGIIFTVILCSLLIIPFFISLDSYKGLISSEVQKATGRELIIDGKISAAFLPRPRIKLENLKLTSLPKASRPYFIEVKQIIAALDISKLLVGKLGIAYISLDRPHVSLEKLQEGNGTWEFTKATTEPAEYGEERKVSNNTNILPIVIENIKINDGTVEYIDRDKKIIINRINSSIHIKDLKGKMDFAFKCTISEQDYNLHGTIKEIGNTIPLTALFEVASVPMHIDGVLDRENMLFKGSIKSEGNIKNFKNLQANLQIPQALQEDYKFASTFSINEERINIDSINLAIGQVTVSGNGSYYMKNNNGTLNMRLNPGNVNVNISPLATAEQRAHNITIQAQAIAPMFEILAIGKQNMSNFLDKPLSFSALISYDKDLVLKNMTFSIGAASIKGLLGLKELRMDPMKIFYNLEMGNGKSLFELLKINLPLNINNIKLQGETVKEAATITTNTKISAAQLSVQISGNVRTAPSIKPLLTVDMVGNNLSRSLQELFKTSLNPKLTNCHIHMKIDGDLSKQLQIVLNNSNIVAGQENINLDGKMLTTFSAERPKMLMDLTVSSLPFDNIIGSNTTTTQPVYQASPQTTQIQSPWSRNKIDLSFLRSFDGSFTISLHKLTKASLVFDNIKTIIQLNNGALDVTSLVANLYGGQINGKAHLSAQGAQPMSIDVSLSQAQLKDIIPDHKAIKISKGNFSLKTNLKSHGDSSYAYINNLSGSAEFMAHDGKLIGMDLQKVIHTLTHIKNLESVLGGMNNSFLGGETVFKKLEGNLDIQNGVATFTKLQLDSAGLTASGKGNINLPRYFMDINSTINVNIGKMPAFDVRFYGPIDSPKHQLNVENLKRYILENVLNTVVDTIKHGKSSPKDLIKNILGSDKKNSEAPEDNTQTDKPEADNPANKIIKKGLKGLFK